MSAGKYVRSGQLHLVTATGTGPTTPRAAVMTDSFSASIAGYSDWLPFSPGRNKGPATVDRYVGIVTRFAAWCREHGRASFAEVTKADLRAWVNSLKGGQAAPGTKALSWWAIRSLFRYLSEEEGVPDIARSLTMHAPPVSDRISHLDAGDVRLLLRACQTARERAVIRVFLDSGLRISEAASLKVCDVIVDNLRSRRLIVTGKGGKTRAVVIGTQTAMELRRYLRERQKSPWAECEGLWLGARGPLTVSGLRELVEATGRRASLQVHPHLLRHTWAHHYRLNGGQTDNLTYLAGWAGPAMALRYGRSAAAERAEMEARGLSLVDRLAER